MTTTSHLGIALIDPSQAQKEVTVNTALVAIDALMNTGVKDMTLSAPPSSPAAGDVYIVAASPTGAWAGQAKNIAYFDQIWRFIVPNQGMHLWVNSVGAFYVYNGTAWVGDSGVTGPGSSTDGQIALFNGSSGAVIKTAAGTGFVKVSGGVFATQTGVSLASDVTGTLAAANFPALTGDVTTSAGSLATSIANNAVSYGKLQQVAATSLVGNSTGSTANAAAVSFGTFCQTANNLSDVTAATARSNLGLGSLATASSVNLSTQATGTLQAAQHPALTGDVTNSAGSLATSIANNAVTYAKFQQVAATSLVGNSTGSAANAAAVSFGTFCQTANNLSDVTAATARSNLGMNISVNAPASSATNITLTNPLASVQNISFSATGKNLILPAMNTGNSIPPGWELTIKNTGSNAFGILANDGSTVVLSALNAGDTVFLTLLTNSTANGTFQANVLGSASTLDTAQVLQPSNNLSDVGSASTARSNLGLGSLATASSVNLTTQATGTLQAAQHPALTGDVTNSAGSLATTIANNAVTYAKFQQVAATSLVGNSTGSTANAAAVSFGTFCQAANNLSDVTAATARSNLGLGSLATASSVNLTTQATGTLQA
ncbi:MAG: DUF2793 domain-containing protein, partial [Alphaproteobacteria bacterium]|nr:DUF2793 domain-containing protein [Alphaproteobacteria bacterium]